MTDTKANANDDILPCNHPSVSGRERELRALTDVVRRLIGLTVTNTADASDTVALTAELSAVADRISAHVPNPVPPRLGPDRPAHGAFDGMPYDVVHGRYNPLAIPVEMHNEHPKAIGIVTFTTPYEGPPGCVHGGVLAGVFDMVLTAANLLDDAAGPTVELTINYRKPTLLHTETRFEAWVEGRKGRVTTAAGRALQDDKVTVEAIGKFIKLEREQVIALQRRAAEGRSTA
ncbi:MAG: PaaI family thioesterase [Acidimicrobiia bacterium]|nr:PaaI family thioesterase [Acidimicrobiia bacterium]